MSNPSLSPNGQQKPNPAGSSAGGTAIARWVRGMKSRCFLRIVLLVLSIFSGGSVLILNVSKGNDSADTLNTSTGTATNGNVNIPHVNVNVSGAGNNNVAPNVSITNIYNPPSNSTPTPSPVSTPASVPAATPVVTPTPNEPSAPSAGAAESIIVPLSKTEQLKMILVKSGTFMMGSPGPNDADEGLAPEEGRGNEPRWLVHITQDFWMSETEITRPQWKALMGTGEPWREDLSSEKYLGYAENRPMNVSWNDAIRFCKELTKRAKDLPRGYVYSLPTEAQWEYACRAGTTTPYSLGKNDKDNGQKLNALKANYNSKHGHPLPVKSYPEYANAWGFYDMHGNMSEWCLDVWKGRFPEKSNCRVENSKRVWDVENDPLEFLGNERVPRVIRGGNWQAGKESCRSAHRVFYSPDVYPALEGIGFRVVLAPEIFFNAVEQAIKEAE